MPATSARGLARLLSEVEYEELLFDSALAQISAHCLVLVNVEEARLSGAYKDFEKARVAFGLDHCNHVTRKALKDAAKALGAALLAIPDITLQLDTV